MAVKMLSIEVGERFIKVCTASKTGTAVPKFEDGFKILIPQDAVADGNINQPKELADLILSKLREKGLSGLKNVTFTVTSSRIASREVSLPFAKEPKLASLVEMNAQDHFPVDLASYQVAYTVLDTKKAADESYTKVMITIAPNAMLAGYKNLADALGMTITAIDAQGNGQYQTLRTFARPGVTMYVNVGIQYTLVSFFDGKNLLLQRSFTFGGNDLISLVMQENNMQDSDYELAITSASAVDFFKGKEIEERANLSVNRLADGIVRSVDFFKTVYKDQNVGQVILFGDCSKLAGLREAVTSISGMPTDHLEFAVGLDKVPSYVKVNSEFIACLGSIKQPLDLLPELRSGKKGAQASSPLSMLLPALFFLVALAAGGSMVFNANMELGDKQDELKDMENRILELAYVDEVYNTYVEYQAAQDQFEIIEAAYDNNNAGLRAFLEELEAEMPSSLIVLSASCGLDSVTLNLTSATMEDAILTVSKLRAFESIGELQVSSLSVSEDETGEIVTFSIAANYAVPVVEEAVAE